MPLMTCREKHKSGFKYGESGHCYTYSPGDEAGRKRAKHSAIIQGTAIAQSTGEKLTIKMEMKKASYNDENNLIFGWAYVAIEKDGKQVIDSSKERITKEDLEDLEIAIYGFNVGSRKSGFMHKGLAKGVMVESMVFTKEKLEKMELPEDVLPQGVWAGFWFPNNIDYQNIKKMKSPMFSIQGSAIKEEVD